MCTDKVFFMYNVDEYYISLSMTRTPLSELNSLILYDRKIAYIRYVFFFNLSKSGFLTLEMGLLPICLCFVTN